MSTINTVSQRLWIIILTLRLENVFRNLIKNECLVYTMNTSYRDELGLTRAGEWSGTSSNCDESAALAADSSSASSERRTLSRMDIISTWQSLGRLVVVGPPSSSLAKGVTCLPLQPFRMCRTARIKRERIV
jgi:hypothetical protein